MLVVLTASLFPILYLTLELPKRIINDAIGATSDPVTVLGVQIPQVHFLWLLCFGFLLSVIAQGLMKMRVNTMKGILAERMLRRFRYDLITRVLRFPQPYFQRTSQGEIVSMVTAEAEQLGGMMGEAISQPVLQAGQMLTILGFLLMQSVWFALAAVALIPLQAWLIPRMQRQINVLNRARVKEVRKLASEIGETAAGAVHLRRSGSLRHRRALVSERLGILFHIRFEIYQKKFFMKFVNNFITQLTPLLFYSFGGYLVIQGNLSLGALVAALAAHKDLSTPWNELLAYYNQLQEAQLRWTVVTERFAPEGMFDERLFDGEPAVIPRLTGDIELVDVSLRSADGAVILRDITTTLPRGRTIAIAAESEEDRRALAELMTRETRPSSGSIRIAGHDLASLHQGVIAARIGYAGSRPFVMQGTFGANLLWALWAQPASVSEDDRFREAKRAGNSPDPLNADWLDPARADLGSAAEVSDWWLDLAGAIDTEGRMFDLGLDQTLDPAQDPVLAARLVALRPVLGRKLAEADLGAVWFPFDRSAYNPALPLAGNLLFAMPRAPITPEVLMADGDFLGLLRKLKLERELLDLARDVVEMLRQTFGLDGTDHPLFRNLGLDPAVYARAVELLEQPGTSDREYDDQDLAVLLSVPFQISAEQIGPAFTEAMQARIVRLRQAEAAMLRDRTGALFAPLDADALSPGLSVLENVIFGKISESAGSRADRLREIVRAEVRAAGLDRPITALVQSLPTDLGGGNLSSHLVETLDLCRAAIKKPDVLILDQVLASQDAASRSAALARLRRLLPEATIILLQARFADPSEHDLHFEIAHGQIVGAGTVAETEDNVASADLARKLRLLETTELFAGLDRRQQRLLAFGARWYTAAAGTDVFHKNDDPSDGAYLIAEGEAGLYLPVEGGPERLIASAMPGTLVGELGLIRGEPRSLGMRAQTDLVALRISAEAFLAVVQNDAPTAFRLLQVVAGYLPRSGK